MEPYTSENSSISLAHFKDDYVLNNIETVYPVLLQCFAGSTEDSITVHALRIAFGPCLELFSLDELDEKVLKHACPVAKNVFIRTLKDLEIYREENKYDISQNICNCEEITSMLAKAMEHVTANVSTIDLVKIENLLLCASELLCEFYTHCSNSKYFSTFYVEFMSKNLTSFYRKAQDLQHDIFQLLSKIEINSTESALNEILTFVYKSGIALLNLDVKTMADLWKGYISNVDKYCDYLKSDHEISIPVECLSENLINKLEKLFINDSLDSQTIDKTVKILCFILKVIIKLTEKFSGYLKNCHNSLLNLLINLNKFSYPQLKPDNVEHNNVEQLRQLITGVDPLLSCLISDKDFAHKFSGIVENTEKESSERYSLLLMLCLIVKKLTFASQETRNIWFSSDYNILRWIFQLLSKCNFELCLNLKFSCIQVAGKAKRLTDCYGYLLMHLSAFLLMSTSREFVLAEIVLIKYLLQPHPWCSLLASDLWCILARFAESDLCYEQLNNLVKLLNNFGTWSELPQKILLESLIKRLYTLLSRKHQELFAEKHPRRSYPVLWKILKIPVFSGVIQNENSLITNVIDKFLTNTNFNAKDFEEIESSFLGLRIETENSGVEMEKILVKFWKFDSLKLISNLMCKRYLSLLCSATVAALPFMSTTGNYQILREIKSSLQNLSPSTKLHSLEIVYRCSKSEGLLNGEAICQLISSFFYDFLTNPNVFIRMRSMDLFSNFAYSTCKTQIITQSINNDSALQIRLKNYLQRKHEEANQNLCIKKVLHKLENSKYEHFCSDDYKTEVYRSDCQEPPPKKIILDKNIGENSELDHVIFTLKKETVRIQQQAGDLSLAQRKDLSLIADLLRDILE